MLLVGRQQEACKGIITLMLQNLWKSLSLSNCKIGQCRQFCTSTHARIGPYLNKPANFYLIGCYVESTLLLSTALQPLVQSFGLLNHLLPSSPILDKGLPIWHF